MLVNAPGFESGYMNTVIMKRAPIEPFLYVQSTAESPQSSSLVRKPHIVGILPVSQHVRILKLQCEMLTDLESCKR